MNPSSQPENQLDNDKDRSKAIERRQLKYGVIKLQTEKGDYVVSSIVTPEAMDSLLDYIERYTQSKLKAFAGEVES